MSGFFRFDRLRWRGWLLRAIQPEDFRFFGFASKGNCAGIRKAFLEAAALRNGLLLWRCWHYGHQGITRWSRRRRRSHRRNWDFRFHLQCRCRQCGTSGWCCLAGGRRNCCGGLLGLRKARLKLIQAVLHRVRICSCVSDFIDRVPDIPCFRGGGGRDQV